MFIFAFLFMKLAIEIPNLVLIFFQLILWNKLRESEPIRLLEMTGSLGCNYFNSRTFGSRKLFIHIRQFFLLRLSIKFKYWISSSSISSTSRNNYSMYIAWFHYMPSVLNVFFLSGIMRFVYDSAWTLNIHSQLHGKPSREENCVFRLTGREMLRGKFH